MASAANRLGTMSPALPAPERARGSGVGAGPAPHSDETPAVRCSDRLALAPSLLAGRQGTAIAPVICGSATARGTPRLPPNSDLSWNPGLARPGFPNADLEQEMRAVLPKIWHSGTGVYVLKHGTD
jgi:hypothetical protein